MGAILQSLQKSVRNLAQAGNRGSDFPADVVAETLRQDAALIEGIAAYRRHDWQRTLSDPPAIWSEGSTRLRAPGGQPGRAAGAVRSEPDQSRICA